MALEDLTKKILVDADTQVQHAHKRAADTVAHISQEAEREMSILKTSIAKETEQLLSKQSTLETQRTEQEVRTRVEGAQRTLLNDTFSQALRAVLEAPETEYVQYVESELALLAKSGETILTVFAPASRISCTKDLCARVGISAPVEAREDIQGGFVAVGEISEYDARLEQRMSQVQRTHESLIARTLFGA